MAGKRLLNDGAELDEFPDALSPNAGPSASARKRLKDNDSTALSEVRPPSTSRPLDDFESNEVNSVVKDLVTELVNTTTESEQLELSVASLDDSFKLNYDFSLVADPAADLLADHQSDELANQPNDSADLTSDLYGSARFDNSFTEHNYANNCANVPSTSCAAQCLNSINQSSTSHPHSSKPVKGALRFANAMKSTNKKNVKFKGVTVFYFSRNQGGSTVPSQGGSTLGMDMNHCDSRNFTLDAHQEEKRQVHREILLRQKRYEKMYQKQQARTASANQSDSDDDSLGNISDISDSELEFDSWYFLQPVPVKQRRALLRESGINKIDSSEKEECRDIRQSREFCGCDCRIYCDESTCQCSLAGIKCQVDRLNFPCGCSRESCGNVNGRIEFNPIRVRTHFIHTIMRLEMDKKKESQQYLSDESASGSMLNPVADHPYHLKANHHPSIELMNQNNALFPPLSPSASSTVTSNQLESPYELKFIQTNSMQSSDSLYGPLDANTLNNSNLLNCNEVPNLIGNEYDEFYEDSGDSGSSSYSESSDCTSEELDCRLTTAADNQTLNGLPAFNLSPFSLISNVPTTNSELAAYDSNQAAYSSNHFLTDQSFRYYSPLPNNGSPGTLTQQLDQTNATADDQLMSNHHLHYSSYYQDSSLYIGGNLTPSNPTPLTGDCYPNGSVASGTTSSLSSTGLSDPVTISSSALPNPALSSTQLSSSQCKPVVANEPLPSLSFPTDIGGHLLQSFETHHYTDLSQSIASKSTESINLLSAANVCPVLLSTDSSTVLGNEFDVVVQQLTGDDGHLVNSSSCSDDSSSGQSTQNELCEEQEDNFGEIIKNATIGVESVTA